ncbi:50S ribosomal protein L13 [Patescibacteria group bacterium]|nr:50S ribosomal protein L13 [Patescibacteria group bacterium]
MSKIKIDRKIQKLDARGEILGRFASQIAQLLMGKGKESYVPNVDVGDIVIVKNMDKIKVTGNKLKQKKYYRHSGYTGNLKIKKMEEILEESPEKLLEFAVFNMLPKNKLRKPRMKRLRFE